LVDYLIGFYIDTLLLQKVTPNKEIGYQNVTMGAVAIHIPFFGIQAWLFIIHRPFIILKTNVNAPLDVKCVFPGNSPE